MLSRVQDRVKEKGYHLTFSREVVEKMAQEGFDPVYGARPLRRAIQKRVEDSLASFLLEGSFVPGDEIRVILEDGEIRYRKEEKEA
jgi:ATP-dependent Clp protease ATP-binding subunit ClpA